MTPDLVSLVVPCFNGERHLRAALESALAQTWPSIEVLLVDDGSTDASVAIARSFGDRVTVLRQEQGGVSRARNKGLEASHGAFVHFLDADDVLPAGAIEEKVALFRLYPEADAVYSRSFIPFATEFGADVVLPRGYAALAKSGRLTRATGCIEALGMPCPACTPVLYKRGVLEKAGGFDPGIPVQENIELNLRLYLDGAFFVYVDTIGLVYRNDREVSRATDRETYLSRDLLVATEGMVEMVRARQALDGELSDTMTSWIVEAGHVAAAAGSLELAADWFALAERIRKGAVPLRPLLRWLGPVRASRVERRVRHLARHVGLRRKKVC